MKSIVVISAITAAMVLTFSGCSTKNQYGQIPNQLIEKHKSLPSWVNEDNGLTAVGSATYKGQSYIQQKNQAVAIAKMNLGRKVETKVDSLVRDYFQTTGNKDAMLEEVSSQTTSQVSSQILKGVSVKQVFVSEDGEMFVQVVIDADVVASYYAKNTQMQKYLFQQLQAEKSFQTLKQEVKEYKQEQNYLDKNTSK